MNVLIIGTGIAGLSAALKLADHVQVTLVAKDRIKEGASSYAQGGIASVWSPEDSFQEHQNDTLQAGAGLCREEIVEICVQDGPRRVQELIDWGVLFSQDQGRYDLHREGGHGQRRILHASDITGRAIIEALVQRVVEHPQVQILENHTVIDLITNGAPGKGTRCRGAYVLNSETGKISTIESEVTILATGGAGKVYRYTSNPDVATGDGVAMAYRAGARIANMEFFQFHPTCLFHPKAKTFLISEALRGEGAELKNLAGEAFMKRYDERGSLASRDIVARAIDQEMKRRGDPHVWLDATHLGADVVEKKFPNLVEVCQRYGFSLVKEQVPVVPAAHYMCGGVLVDEDGKSSIEGLYGVGEVACTGLHGANRLASNSLLEAVVFAHRATASILPGLGQQKDLEVIEPLPEWDSGLAVEIEEKIDIAAVWSEVRNLMWNYVGIVRSDRRLERARRRLVVIQEDVLRDYWKFFLTRDLIELRNLVTVADLIIQSASLRRESRGLHFTVDYPERDDRNFGKDSIL